MLTPFRLPRVALTIACAVLLGACADSPTENGDDDPLEGLLAATVRDSVGNGIPEPLSAQGSGYVIGTVMEPGVPGAGGNDSLATKPRIAGVTVRVYEIDSGGETANAALGDLVATVVTDANGRFQTPVIDGTEGEHILLFTPPSGSAFRSAYARTRFWTGSHTTPWWVTLHPAP